MAITVVCACGKRLQVKAELAGRRGKCPGCGQMLTIPQPEPEPSDPLGLDPLSSWEGLGDLSGLPGLPGSALGSQPMAGAGQAGFGQTGGTWGSPLTGGQAGSQPKQPNRKLIYALCGGGGGLALLAVLIVIVIFSWRPKPSDQVAVGGAGSATTTTSTAPPVSPSALSPPTPSLQIQITPTPELALEPGAVGVLNVVVTRGNLTGPIQLTVSGLPNKVTAPTIEIAADRDSAAVELTVAADAAEGAATVRVLAAAGQVQAEQAVSLAVKQLPLPSFTPLAGVTLLPGARRVVEFSFSRNGFEGPIALALEGLPEKISCQNVEIAKDQSSAKLELVADAAAAESATPIRAVATVGKKRVEAEFSLSVERYPFRLETLPVVLIEPGKSLAIEVKVERRSYKGPLAIQVEGLPGGVVAGQATIADDQLSTKLELTAAADAKDRVRSAKVVSAGTQGRSEQLLIVRVKKGDGERLPDVDVDSESKSLVKRGSFGGRMTYESKQVLLDVFGGTPESESAVLSGLRWLANHQAADGHWSLEQYNAGSTACNCRIPFEQETDKNDTAATAFGLLPFLGAGVRPNDAPNSPTELRSFQKNVQDGLAYLVKHQKVVSGDTNGDLGGGMYAHAFGTIALCEAYAMTKHKDLLDPTRRAVRYLLEAQHDATGGWGYGPNQVGDMSVVGWVGLAVRSGQMSGLAIEPARLRLTEKFLNSTSAGPPPLKKSRYSYKPGMEPTLALTAAGLLSRQYLGWQPDQPDLLNGCKYLMEQMPPENSSSLGAIYYYYYATQVLHHMEGQDWDQWNHRMREHLIRTQEQSGHRQGSWSPEGCDHGKRGGRMYSTALSLLTLEVYYRHLPLYRKAAKPDPK